jgi:nitrogen fixation protein FixH
MTVNDDFAEFESEALKRPARKAPAKKAAAKRAPAKKTVSKIPATAKQPQDRKTSVQSGDKARRREANGVEMAEIPITTKAGGSMTATIPLHQGDWPVRAIQHFARNQHIDAIEYLFGVEQWNEYLDLNPTLNDLNTVGEVVAKELGMDSAGN